MLNCCGKFWAVQVTNNLMNTIQNVRNGSDEVGPVGCDIRRPGEELWIKDEG